MSIYMDKLPECCDMCVCNDDYWRCGINGEDIEHDGRREDCPLKVIVRCGHCKWWKCNPNTEEYGVCKKVSYDDFEVVMDSDDFCSYGVKWRTSDGM